MPPETPSWFKQRQCKCEPAGNDRTVKVTGPNLGEAYLGIVRADNNRWQAFLRANTDGPDVARTEPEIDTVGEAWEAAFELYRTHVIV